MKVQHHVVASLAVSGVLFGCTKSIPGAAACLLSGIFIDLDHVIDYLIIDGWSITIPKLLKTFYQGLHDRAYVVFHGWELAAVLVTVAYLTKWNPLAVGLAAGVLHHLILDQIANRPSPFGYFLTYRWLTKFSYRRSFPEGGLETLKPRRSKG